MKQHSWLQSDNFLKRCFAIYGHVLVAHVIVSAALLALWMMLMGLATSLFLHSGMRHAYSGKRVDMLRDQRQEMPMRFQAPQKRQAPMRRMEQGS